MQIENKTEFKKDMIKNIMRADGFDNQTYKTKKLVLNMSGRNGERQHICKDNV